MGFSWSTTRSTDDSQSCVLLHCQTFARASVLKTFHELLTYRHIRPSSSCKSFIHTACRDQSSKAFETTHIFTMRSCYRAFLLACALVISFCVSFVFSKGPQFNDWHYEYRVLSYGPSRSEKLDRFPRVPNKFTSTGGSRKVQVMSPGQHDMIDYSFLAQE